MSYVVQHPSNGAFRTYDPMRLRSNVQEDEQRRDWRAGQNGQRLLCRLPDDVLLLIVKEIQKRAPRKHLRLPDSLHARSKEVKLPFVVGLRWLRITWVCQALRHGIHRLGKLWANIDARWHPPIIGLFLSHVQGHPLLVSGSRTDHLTQKTWARLHQYSCALHLVPLRRNEHDLSLLNLHNALDLSAPYLEWMTYDFSHVRRFVITDRFLGGVSLTLGELFLTNVTLHDVPALPALRHLTLIDVFLTSGTIAILNLLSHTTRLWRLEIEGIRVPSPPEYVMQEQRCLELPELKWLLIFGRLDLVQACLWSIPNPAFVLNIASWVQEMSPPGETPRVHKLVLAMNQYLLYRMRGFWDACSGDKVLPNGTVRETGWRSGWDDSFMEVEFGAQTNMFAFKPSVFVRIEAPRSVTNVLELCATVLSLELTDSCKNTNTFWNQDADMLP
jgi:hypothetical protein